MSFDEVKRRLRSLTPMPVNDGIRLCEIAYGIVEEAEEIGSGQKLFQRSDGQSNTRLNALAKINAVASWLRKQDLARIMTALEWQNVQDCVNLALGLYAGAAAGREYDTAALLAILPDIGENIVDLPGDVVGAAKDAVSTALDFSKPLLIVGAVVVLYLLAQENKS